MIFGNYDKWRTHPVFGAANYSRPHTFVRTVFPGLGTAVAVVAVISVGGMSKIRFSQITFL
jgi:hypothetical protein